MRYVALLRGINLGGNKMIKMAELKAGLERLGFENVATYINSGNVAFDTAKIAEHKLAEKIEASIMLDFGMEVPVMVRSQAFIDRIIENNPFAGEFESHKEVHVLFLREELPREKGMLLTESALEGERYKADGCEIYCHLPNGVANSLLTKGFFEKKPKVQYTGRNWRTVKKLAVL